MELKKPRSPMHPHVATMEKRVKWPLILTATLCGVLILASLNGTTPLASVLSLVPASPAVRRARTGAAESAGSPPIGANGRAPRIAYFVSGSRGDLERLWRALRALYHPRNIYAVHLDRDSPAPELSELRARVAAEPVFARAGNVHVVNRSNMVTYRGPTMVANTLHACAILLRISDGWDWFINLSASDYPLVPQDDILHTFAKLPRNLNFIEHTSNLGWKEDQRAKPIIIDPGLYKSQKSDVFWVSQKRELPDAFKLFTGSAWMALSRAFVEYCVVGWDNLPRTLLMYYTNFVSAPEGYFQTIICNTPDFAPTAVNHDLHYISWDVPPKQHPHVLSLADADAMIGSGAPFARKFARDDPVLDKIDVELLGLLQPLANGTGFVPGGWCAGSPPCSKVGDIGRLHPGPGAKRLAGLIDRIVDSEALKQNQCI
ncbi:beta-glucuronosyltransferase GlcAT14A-like [Ananas comosus]|uniref:Beta-glucuronosyltransferase GlcAT14A-like n=1 Tax=Ananas comosus TaxID=4615 RepID=A0A6P5GIY0_ANACO|nr:beta-glucuronosyltransferase GlcAT14A-like [Ananas comosus]